MNNPRRVYCFLPTGTEPTLATFHGWTPSMQAVVESDDGDIYILPTEAVKAFSTSYIGELTDEASRLEAYDTLSNELSRPC